jgi:plastocyanin
MAATRTIKIAQFAFDPAELRVARGDTVVWENADILPHATSADSAAWASGELAPRSHFRLVVSDTGRFPYHCSAHPTMRGVLIVK